MFHDSHSVRRLYRRLVALYPRAFSEQLGESMEQTFNDLVQERRLEGRWFAFVLWLFVETGIGILKEHLTIIRQGDPMKTILASLKWPAALSLLLVLPFMILEWVNRRQLHEGYPLFLFAVMWLLPVIFLLVLMPLVRSLRAGKRPLASPIRLLLSLAVLTLLTVMWTGVVIDQMPCFLGVPFCD